jgi:Zinc knuckle
MVLGAVGDAPVCYYCNKPGHLRKDCYKLHNDMAAGRAGGGSRRGRGGRNGGRNHGGRSSLNAIGEGTMDVQEVMRLGMAAAANKER